MYAALAHLKASAKAYVAGAVLAVTAAVGQAGALADVNDLGANGYLKALAVAVVGALAVYFQPNKSKA